MTIVCRIGRGLGGKLTSAYMDKLVEEIETAYPIVDAAAFDSSDCQGIIDELSDLRLSDRIIVGGYSWGADNAPIICAALARSVDFMFAFQPSVYYPTKPIGSNVKRALCIYNPWFFETWGLGFQRLYKAEGNEVTEAQVIMAQDSHPAVQANPTYHSMVIREIGNIVNQRSAK